MAWADNTCGILVPVVFFLLAGHHRSSPRHLCSRSSLKSPSPRAAILDGSIMPSVARLWVLPGLVVGISLIFLFGPGIAMAQTSDEAAIKETVRKGLDAYQRKDVDAMFAVFSS